MKRPLALLASFLVLFVLGATLGIAQANPPQAPETTTTPSTTPTATVTATTTSTATLTSTATTNPCDGAPPPPALVGPANGTTLNKTEVTLRWSPSECAIVYRSVVRSGSKSGSIVQRGKSRQLHITTQGLPRGVWYYWLIKACNPGKGCDHSVTWRFRIQPLPTPVPPTPGPTGQPTTQPGGTPVPGTPPGNLVNYTSPDRGGTGVYLNNDNSSLFRYECGKDQNLWGHYPIGSTVYTIALWYYPNEKINYERKDFNLDQVVEQHTLTANSDGYVSYNVNTANWTVNHHYHLIFTGQSSHVSWCGHFDIQSTAMDVPLQPLPHSAADIDIPR